MAGASDDRAALVAFEAGFHALDPFGDGGLMTEAAGVYLRCGQSRAAWLIDAVARQMRRAEGKAGSGEADSLTGLSAAARAVLEHPDPPARLLRRLEQLDIGHNLRGQVELFEAVFGHMPPVGEYWVYHRMSQVYAELGEAAMAFLAASIALQFEPLNPNSLAPARLVIRGLIERGARDEAGRLLQRREAANPDQQLLPDQEERDRLLAHAHAAASETLSRRDRVMTAASELAAVPIAVAGRGLPHWLEPMLRPQPRPAITLSELDDAELLIADNAVSVWDSEGALQAELSVGAPPGLVRMALERRFANGEAVDELRFESAVLIGDRFPTPNLCHFMLDQASRLALYKKARFDFAQTVVIGPDLLWPYQRMIARRLGARNYLGTGGHGRVQVGRLGVLSNCHHLRHSGHLGADWTVGAVRAAFADLMQATQPPRRLLVSRADARARRVINEDALLALLRPFGFELIVPGELSLSEQVRAFAAATHVVAPHGAGLANVVFCAPGTRVLEIFHPHYGTASYAVLVPALRLEYAAMVAWDGESGETLYNDPTIATDRTDASLERHIRVDLAAVEAWVRSNVIA